MRLLVAATLLISSIALLAAFRPEASPAPIRRTPTPTWPDSPEEDDFSECLEIAKNGSPLIVPVNVEGVDYPFLVDTGFSGTALDRSLCTHLRPTGDEVSVNGSGKYPLYDPPEMTVGKSRIPVRESVLGLDMTAIRKNFGPKVRGILGMTFLSLHVVVIDFDEGTLTFRKTAPRMTGSELPLSRTRGKCPAIDVTFGEQTASFLVDTGCSVFCAGVLKDDLFDNLVRRGELQCGDETTRFGTIHGIAESTYGRLNRFAVGENFHQRLYFSRGNKNIIGLSYLSRYVVTLDFPKQTIALTPRRQIASRTAFEVTGLSFERRAGETIVEEVATESTAAAAGICIGDRVLEIDGKSADESPLSDLCFLLSSARKSLELTVQRDGAVHRLELVR